MPIYEYQCETCDKRTEAIQRLDEAPLVICPHCGGALKKLMSAPSFQFKGTGWYVTDYAGKKGGGDKGTTADNSTSGSSKSASDKKSGSGAQSNESGSSSKSEASGSSSSS